MGTWFSNLVLHSLDEILMEYDRFPPRSRLDINGGEFVFYPRRYEIWKDQKNIESGECGYLSEISAKVAYSSISMSEVLQVNVEADGSLKHLLNPFFFDLLVANIDRIMLVRVPPPDTSDSPGLVHFREKFIGVTHDQKLVAGTPFVCSVFFIDSKIVTMAFTISNPELYIEFTVLP